MRGERNGYTGCERREYGDSGEDTGGSGTAGDRKKRYGYPGDGNAGDGNAGAYTTIAKAYIYDLYLADLNAKTIKCFKHGEYFRGGGGSERDVDGELIHYTYSGSNAAAEEQEKAKQDYIKWFASKTKGQINEKDVCIYCYGEDRIEGWNGIVKEWRMAFIASDDKYYEVYFYIDGNKRLMTCEEAGGKLISKKEKWEE